MRFYALRAVSFGQDGTASVVGVGERYERELGNDLGNLLSRTTAMIAKYREGEIPTAEPDDLGFGDLGERVARKLDVFDLTGALEDIWSVVRALNGYVTEQKPWELAKDDGRAADLDRVLFTLADGLRVVAVALASYLPETAPKLLRALGQPEELSWERAVPGLTETGGRIEPAPPLFPRIEVPTAA